MSPPSDGPDQLTTVDAQTLTLTKSLTASDVNQNAPLERKKMRKRRSERFSELLKYSDKKAASGAPICSRFPVKKSSKATEMAKLSPPKMRKVDTTATGSVVARESGRIPGLSNDSLADRLKFRSVQKMDVTKSKNRGFISKSIIDALTKPSAREPIMTDIDRSLPAIPAIKTSKYCSWCSAVDRGSSRGYLLNLFAFQAYLNSLAIRHPASMFLNHHFNQIAFYFKLFLYNISLLCIYIYYYR